MTHTIGQKLYIGEADEFAQGRESQVNMKRRRRETEHSGEDQGLAVERAKLWTDRAISARKAGRIANASRCEDKARDWSSRARQIERLRREAPRQ